MKWCCLFVGALILYAPAFALDEEPVLAQIINSSTNRIPVQTVVPEYPRKARRDRIEGKVQVCFEVTREGRTRRIGVRTSTHRDFERPSIRAIRASRFRPIGKDETLQAIKSCRTFIFSLEPAEEDDDAAEDVEQADHFG